MLMSVGSLGPADSKFIFLNIRKRIPISVISTTPGKGGSKFYVFQIVLKKVGSTYTTEPTRGT